MGIGIMICGCNGSGKSTFGKALAERLEYIFIDIEDCCFPRKSTSYPYTNSLSHEEATELLTQKVQRSGRFVFAGVKGDYGEEITLCFQGVVVVDAPKDVRIDRVKKRSFEKFGSRMLPGGDLYEAEKRFLDMISARTEEEVEKWVDTLSCPILRIDGTKAVQDNVQLVTDFFCLS